MRAVIVANGEVKALERLRHYLNKADYIIAADGGARHCEQLGVRPDLVIGDMDSIRPSDRKWFSDQKVPFHTFPERKDATDLELAINLAVEKNAEKIDIFGALGQRWDMSLANLMLLGAPAYEKIEITLFNDDTRIWRIPPGRACSVTGRPGDRVSFVPIGSAARQVALKGFEYPLDGVDLDCGSTRGVSNILRKSPAEVFYAEGLLFAVVSESSPQIS